MEAVLVLLGKFKWAAISLVGSLVTIAYNKYKGNRESWMTIFLRMFMAVSLGSVIGEIGVFQDSGMNGALCGLVGACSPEIIDIIKTRFPKIIEKRLDDFDGKV